MTTPDRDAQQRPSPAAGVPPAESLLFAVMMRRYKELRRKGKFPGRIDDLAANKTRYKIRDGFEVEPFIYERLDDLLGWVPGDAERAAKEKISPRLKEDEGAREANESAIKIRVYRHLSQAGAAIEDATPATLREVDRLAQEILDLLE